MRAQVILDTLREYVDERILQDPAVAIDPDTPLLEWGILNSVSTVQLIGFIRERFGVDVPPEEVAGANFRDLRSITRLLVRTGMPASRASTPDVACHAEHDAGTGPL
jgi:acyl carrier protein